jgi:hypothetical protein
VAHINGRLADAARAGMRATRSQAEHGA